MNFITRNLGWLLLLLFFLFMLFVISSNGKTPGENGTGSLSSSGELISQTSSGSEDLDTLVEMMNKDDVQEAEKQEEKQENLEEKGVETANLLDETEEEKQSLFSRIFGKKEMGEEKIEEGEDAPEEENLQKQDKQESVRNITINGNSRESGNLTKDSGLKITKTQAYNITKYAPEVLKEMYPGLDLQTTVGKQFQVGVHSLKLNNIYFNETLGYMLEGEKVTQLMKENSYGCFQVEVESSKQKGYVCKKYLKELDQAQENDTGEVIVETIESPTQIGDLITIELSEITFGDNIIVQLGDIVDQMTPTDVDGCFTAHVYRSSVPLSQGKVGELCYKDLK